MALVGDPATAIVGQYFKRRRHKMEVIMVSASGLGLAFMSALIHLGTRYVTRTVSGTTTQRKVLL